jgi:DNA polymerase III epsilon subunit-like protein
MERWSCWQGAAGSHDPLDYTLRADELRWYGYPSQEAHGYRQLPHEFNTSPRVFGLDCEMVITADGPSLARVSLVQLKEPRREGEPRGQLVYDALVKPTGPVLDYVSEHSGVTAQQLEGVTRTASQALDELCALVKRGDILCGHNLKSDLTALQLFHDRIIDTQVLYPHREGPLDKRSLESLCQEHLKRKIQLHAHSSIEDALTALELVMLRIESGQGRLIWAPIEGEEEVEPTLSHLLSRLRLKEEEVRCVYLRGSRAVGYANTRRDGHPSDWDFVMVTRYHGASQEDVHLCYGALEAVLYDEQTFARLLRDCSIWALECIFARRDCILKEEIDFRALFAVYREQTPRGILHSKLRRSVSFESGRKWSKAKRQLQAGDQHSGRKQMFIALRFLGYGIELARTGAIVDLSSANDIWTRLLADPGTTWSALRLSFEPLYKERKAVLHQETPTPPRYGGPRHQPQQARRQPSTISIAPIAQLSEPKREETPLETVRLLRALGDDPEAALETLQRTFQLQVERHAGYPNVVQLRYTPRSEPRTHPVVRECRGLILDAAHGFEVLAYPFARFFNLSEQAAPSLDWSTARAFEKLDGSLAILYWYDDSWRVASSRRPDASGLLGTRSEEGGISFEGLFWEIWHQEGYQVPPAKERRCYMFELTSKRHPIIVRYPEERLTLLGVRDLTTHQELEPSTIAADLGWRSLAALFPEVGTELQRRLREEVLQLDASIQEGFVICDAQFQRVKLKSPDYLRMTWMFPLCPSRERLNKRHLLRLVLSGETQEFLSYCPEYREELREAIEGYETLCAAISSAYEQLQHISDPAEVARRARAYPFSDVLFGMKKQRRGAHEVMLDLPIKKVERWLSR